MKNKKTKIFIGIFALLLIGIITFFTVKHFTNEEKPEETETIEITPLLYEVTKENTDTKIYLFGSIHAGDKRTDNMPEVVMNAYNESDYLAVELDMISFNSDFESQRESIMLLTLEPNTTLKETLREETYTKLIDYLKENNSYSELYEYYGPAFQYSLISNIQLENADLNANKGIDMIFTRQAKKDEKEIIELESAKYQYEMLSNFDNELYDLLINYSITYDEVATKELEDLYVAWLNGDAEKIMDSSEGETEVSLELYETYPNANTLIIDYNEKLLYKRNIEMTNKLDNYFKEGKNIFVVVGIAHILGDDGIIDLLQNKEYTVSQIMY